MGIGLIMMKEGVLMVKIVEENGVDGLLILLLMFIFFIDDELY